MPLTHQEFRLFSSDGSNALLQSLLLFLRTLIYLQAFLKACNDVVIEVCHFQYIFISLQKENFLLKLLVKNFCKEK